MFKSKKRKFYFIYLLQYKLSEIFKNWPTEKPFDINEFDNFCYLLATLTDE